MRDATVYIRSFIVNYIRKKLGRETTESSISIHFEIKTDNVASREKSYH